MGYIKPYMKAALLLFSSFVVFAFMGAGVYCAHTWSAERIGKTKASQKDLLAQEERLSLDEMNSSLLKRQFPAYKVEELLRQHSPVHLEKRMQALASLGRMTDFRYTLSDPIDIKEQASDLKHNSIPTRLLTISSNAPHDAAIFDFLQSLGTSGGRFDIETLTIEKLPAASEQRPSPENVKWFAKLIWHANSLKEM